MSGATEEEVPSREASVGAQEGGTKGWLDHRIGGKSRCACERDVRGEIQRFLPVWMERKCGRELILWMNEVCMSIIYGDDCSLFVWSSVPNRTFRVIEEEIESDESLLQFFPAPEVFDFCKESVQSLVKRDCLFVSIYVE